MQPIETFSRSRTLLEVKIPPRLHVDQRRVKVTGEPVTIAAYDPHWPERYREERRLVVEALGSEVVVEHVGSTAVPGLAAKPVIDLVAGVRRLPLREEENVDLAERGYELRGEAGVPGRAFFRKFTSGVRTHHLHVTVFGGEFWREHLSFRDYLRAHSGEADRYEKLKRDLAAAYRMDRERYTAGKSGLILEIMTRVKAWDA